MTLPQYTKKPLDLNLYAKYEIPMECEAYEYVFAGVELDRIDELEFELTQMRLKIVHSEAIQMPLGLYQLIFIATKAPLRSPAQGSSHQ